jgi:hypothetical protein
MVSACARHPTATVVVTLIATEGKVPAANFFAGVTVITLIYALILDRGCASTS